MHHVFTVSENETGMRADLFLTSHCGMSRSKIKRLMDDGKAVFADGTPVKPSHPVESGEELHLTVQEAREPDFEPENIPLTIIHEDEYIIVVDKPPGMVVHPGRGNYTGTLASALLHHCRTLSRIGGEHRPGIVHRLDKDTSGLIIAALSDDIHLKLARMIRERCVTRIYTAFVWGHPEPDTGAIEAPVGRHPKKPTLRAVVDNGKPSISEYKTLERYDFLSKLEVRLGTGRTHQIRVHLSHINHHVFGDPVYGGREERLKGFSPDIRMTARNLLEHLDRQALHAGRLEFTHPATGENMKFEAPLPGDLAELERMLRKL